MHFGKTNPQQCYILNGRTLEINSQEKDLGIIVDNELKFHVHTASAIKTANRMLGVIKKSYKSRDQLTISLLYKSWFDPTSNMVTIWGPHYQADIVKIERVQRRATKRISGLKDMCYEERLEALKLPSLKYRRRRANMIVMYKIINGIVRIDSKQLLAQRTNTRTRGHDCKIFKAHATRYVGKTNDWNSLPMEVISAPSLNAFKNQLDKHWSNYKFNISDTR